MNFICGHCCCEKTCAEYVGRKMDGTVANFLLCDDCQKKYLNEEYISVATIQGEVCQVTSRHFSATVNENAANGNNHYEFKQQTKKNDGKNSSNPQWTQMFKIISFIVAVLLMLAGIPTAGDYFQEITDLPVLGAILGALVGVLSGYLYLSFSMTFVEISQNVAKLVEQNERKNK